ncbi:MAG: M50 family metallopeptidase [Pyrinomonadaceae bacterium]
MKLRISKDARPQARTLLFAALLSIALWFIPFAEILTYPFRIFVTFIHEGGHALAALLTGNSVASLSVAMNASGETYTTNGGLLSQVFVSSAGYLGATIYGALLLVLIRRAVAARIVLAGTAVLILALTGVYGFLVPLAHGMISPFTVLAGILIPLGLLAVSRYASPRAATFFVSFLAVQCVLNAVFDLKTVFFLSSPLQSAGVATDAQNMANATGIPAILWAAVWIGISFLILSIAMRAYSISRSRHASQQDLPFEDAAI